MTDNTIYISADIEADGKIPGRNSMMSLGSAALTIDGGILDTFYVNLLPLDGAVQDKDTMEWWLGQPEAFAATQVDRVTPQEAMNLYREWLSKYNQPVMVGSPAGYDFTWIYWYLIMFGDYSPFSFSSFDMKTAVSIILDVPYRNAVKRNYPKRWFKGGPKHNHKADVDAVGQGNNFINMMKEYNTLMENIERIKK